MDNAVIILPDNYQPHLDEHYMSAEMLDYFKDKLLKWRQELEELIEVDRQALESPEPRQPDDLDDAIRAQTWIEQSQQLDRHRKLQLQIDAALERIQLGTYGYCVQTGEAIGVKRLQAWPIAELSLQAQARQEHIIKLEQARKRLSLW